MEVFGFVLSLLPTPLHPAAYGSSQARDWIWARSFNPLLWAMVQIHTSASTGAIVAAVLDPSDTAGLGIEPASQCSRDAWKILGHRFVTNFVSDAQWAQTYWSVGIWSIEWFVAELSKGDGWFMLRNPKLSSLVLGENIYRQNLGWGLQGVWFPFDWLVLR